MVVTFSVGVAKKGTCADGTPIVAILPGSTSYWPRRSFDQYLWYRLKIMIPSTLNRPKVVGWTIIPRQEIRITHYVLVNKRLETVYVKEANFFKSQGGLDQDWGKGWRPVHADDLDHARTVGWDMYGT